MVEVASIETLIVFHLTGHVRDVHPGSGSARTSMCSPRFANICLLSVMVWQSSMEAGSELRSTTRTDDANSRVGTVEPYRERMYATSLVVPVECECGELKEQSKANVHSGSEPFEGVIKSSVHLHCLHIDWLMSG